MHKAILTIGEWKLEPHSNLIFNGLGSTKLEHKQVQLLLYLMSNAGNIQSRQNILNEIWSGRVVVEDVIAVAVSRLRKALNDNVRSPQYIKTIPGVGYQFVFPISQANIDLAAQYYNGIIEYSEELEEKSIPAIQSDPAKSNLKNNRLIIYCVFVTLLVAVGLISRTVVQSNQDSVITHKVSDELVKKYQQAQQLRNSFDHQNTESAIDILQNIIRQDPDFADAYVLLAKSKRDLLYTQPLIEYHASEELKALIEKALSINPQSSFAHEALAEVLFLVDWDFTQARLHFEKAIELDPENAEAQHIYGLFLLSQGEFEKSYLHINLSRKLNPLNYSIATVAWIYAMQDRHQEAWQETEKLLTLQPNNLQYHRSAYRLFEASGNQQQAYMHLRKILELAEYNEQELIELDHIFAEKELKGVNHWLAYTHKEEKDIGFYPPPMSYARFAISAGEYDDAFRWLNEAYEQHQNILIWLAIDPKYKPIRKDPRFIALLKKLGLAKISVL